MNARLFALEMASFLDAGLSPVEALNVMGARSIREVDSDHFKGILARVETGMALSESLAKVNAIPAILVALVRATERSGQLKEAFERFAAYAEKVEQAQRKLVTSAIYPAAVLTVGVLVSTFLLLYVVPQFAALYQELNVTLPLASRLLINWGQFVLDHKFRVLALSGFAVILLLWFGRSIPWSVLAQQLTRIRRFRLAHEDYVLGRLYRTLGTLLAAGLTVPESLLLARDVIPSNERRKIDRAHDHIQRGIRFTDAMQQAGLMTLLGERLLGSAEGQDRLGFMLLKAAEIQEDATWRRMDRFIRIVEPVLIASLGLLIGAVVILMYLPIFELTTVFE